MLANVAKRTDWVRQNVHYDGCVATEFKTLADLSAGPTDENDDVIAPMRGIIPRSFEHLFALIDREKQKVCDSGGLRIDAFAER